MPEQLTTDRGVRRKPDQSGACEAARYLVRAHRSLSSCVDWIPLCNISPRQFTNADFVTWFRQTLAHAQFPSDRLLQITSTCLTGDDDTAFANLRALITMGVRFHVDNVGVGVLARTGCTTDC